MAGIGYTSYELSTISYLLHSYPLSPVCLRPSCHRRHIFRAPTSNVYVYLAQEQRILRWRGTSVRHRGRTVSRAFRGKSDNGLLLSLDRTPSWVTRTGSSRNWRVPPLMPFLSCFYALQLSTLIKEKAWDIHRLRSTAVTIPPHSRTTMYVADVEHQPVVASRLPGAQECMISMIPLLN